jgi:cell division protein ZapA
MSQPLEVEIMGQRLTVKSDEGEAHVRQAAGYVDQHMRQLAETRAASALDLALTAALNIASEYWKLRQQQEELSQTINRLAQRVVSRLESLQPAVWKGDDIARR